jgi:glycosyltransferase involved in cell wall biosynthesis
MRLLYFTRDYTPHDHRFLASLAKTENEVYSLRLERQSLQREDRPLPPEVRQVIWRGGQAPFRWKDAPGLVFDLKRVLKEVRPDMVHAGPIPSVAFLAALTRFQPLVSMSWGSDLLRDIDLSRAQKKRAIFALRRTSILLGDCQAVKDKAASLGFPPERVRLFPWGVDLDQFYPGQDGGFRARRGWEEAFVLLSTRSWEAVYGVDVLVKAFARARETSPELRLILLGSGSQTGLIRKIILDHGLEEDVFLGGQVKYADLPGYYRSADLYLSASHSDGSSVSLMEALACGRPALVSEIPGNQEWITPGQEGWLFPDGDVEAMAQGILHALHERDQLAEKGAAARRLAESRADWRKNFSILLEAYRSAVTK